LVDLTVSIVSNDNRELVLECIDSVYRTAGGLRLEIIVVENASRDGSAEAIRARFPGVVLIENTVKEGFSANHNKAIRVATGEFIFILNDDTVVHEGTLPLMVGFLRADPEAGAVGGSLVYPDGTPQYTGKARPTLLAAAMVSLGLHRLFPRNPVTAKYYNRKDSYSGSEEVESINGAALMVRRSMLDKVGLLDEGFFLYCEDVDWCIRMREAGYRLYYLPEAKITHYRGASTKGRRMVGIYHRSLLRFYRKHYAARHSFVVNAAAYSAIWLRFAVFWLLGGVRKN
jgi:GT2 family glycosyltransferase